jgi:hypothetical protein
MHPIFIMTNGTRGLVWALLTVVCLGGLTTRSVPSMSHERPGGCHEQGHKNQVPSPVSYVCCLSGHDPAILPTSLVLPSLRATTGTLVVEMVVQASLIPVLEGLTLSSADPPPVLPLRV